MPVKQITFRECVMVCLHDPQYVRYWAQLRGLDPAGLLLGLSAEGTRWLADAFIADVKDLIWDRIPPEHKTGEPEGPPVFFTDPH